MISLTATDLPRFMACNGSYQLEGFISSDDAVNVTQDEGNAAHWLAQQIHSNQFNCEELIDRKAPNGVFITNDIAEHVEGYVNRIGRSGLIEYETSFRGANWEVRSRIDNIEHTSENVLKVDDFKYGWAIVNVFENWTLIGHAIGYCLKHQVAPARIVFTIHQPRPFHPEGRVRSWEISYNELLSYYDILNKTLSSPEFALHTGEHCYGCKAIATCAAARKAELNAIDASEKVFEDGIDNEHLSFQLDHLSRASAVLKLRYDAYQELALHRIKKGEIVNNYSSETELTNRVWKDGYDVDFLKLMTGIDLSKKQLVTPKQAEKLGVHEDVIKTMTTRNQKGYKLVRMDANKKAEKLFKKG